LHCLNLSSDSVRVDLTVLPDCVALCALALVDSSWNLLVDRVNRGLLDFWLSLVLVLLVVVVLLLGLDVVVVLLLVLLLVLMVLLLVLLVL
ncbi:hypothetical protein, partial [Vibrio alginolyticus]|uniref:hypothetical protein n=1 Tax=Vibrio alginolyticus TaxID=663 RepID=UPI00191C0C41